MNPACFGIMCSRHASCARYHAIDGHKVGRVIGMCVRFTLFVEVVK